MPPSEPDPPPTRRARLGPLLPFLVITLGTFALYAALFVHLNRGAGRADGYYAYVWARSLAFDGDLELRNDYAVCGDPYAVGRDRGTGHPDNQAYVGPAVFWTPVLAVARRVVALPPDAPATLTQGCAGPVVKAALFSAVVLGALAIGLAFQSARRIASPGVAAVAALLFAVSSSLPHYVSLFASSSHAYACFAAALLLWLSLRARDSHALGPYVAVGLAGALLALQRLSDAALVLVPLALIGTSARPLRLRLGQSALVVGGTLLGVGLTLGLYRYLYGSPFVLPQGKNYLHLAHAHPLLTLFAPHGGLLYATPVAYLGLAGLVLGVRVGATRAFALAAAAAFLVCLWISSSALDWHGKGTFGARRLLVLTPLLIVFAALALERALPLLRRHAAVLSSVAVLLFCGAPVLGSTLAIAKGELPVEQSSPQSVQYGSAVRALWALFDARVADLAILPAEIVYAGRYGLPMRSFRAATTDKFYRRSYHSLEFEPRFLEFGDPTALAASKGLAAEANGARMLGSDAKLVFAAGWPFATDAELWAHAPDGAELELDVGTFFRRCSLGARRIEPGQLVTLRWTIPPGCFDSGLMELRIRKTSTGPVVLRRLALDDAGVYPPSY